MHNNSVEFGEGVEPKPLGKMDSDEQMVVVIHRHIAGLIYVYILTIGGLLGATILIGFLLTSIFSSVTATLLLIFMFVAAILGLFLLIATVVYRVSRLIVTNKNLTQIIQRGIFNRKISQLSMANVEDVTAAQKGILATTFNYGTLFIETAGERENFIFDYCPEPRVIAKLVLEARERFIESDPGVAKRANDHLNLPISPTVA